jgi:hypothetical protein
MPTTTPYSHSGFHQPFARQGSITALKAEEAERLRLEG